MDWRASRPPSMLKQGLDRLGTKKSDIHIERADYIDTTTGGQDSQLIKPSSLHCSQARCHFCFDSVRSDFDPDSQLTILPSLHCSEAFPAKPRSEAITDEAGLCLGVEGIMANRLEDQPTSINVERRTSAKEKDMDMEESDEAETTTSDHNSQLFPLSLHCSQPLCHSGVDSICANLELDSELTCLPSVHCSEAFPTKHSIEAIADKAGLCPGVEKVMANELEDQSASANTETMSRTAHDKESEIERADSTGTCACDQDCQPSVPASLHFSEAHCSEITGEFHSYSENEEITTARPDDNLTYNVQHKTRRQKSLDKELENLQTGETGCDAEATSASYCSGSPLLAGSRFPDSISNQCSPCVVGHSQVHPDTASQQVNEINLLREDTKWLNTTNAHQPLAHTNNEASDANCETSQEMLKLDSTVDDVNGSSSRVNMKTPLKVQENSAQKSSRDSSLVVPPSCSGSDVSGYHRNRLIDPMAPYHVQIVGDQQVCGKSQEQRLAQIVHGNYAFRDECCDGDKHSSPANESGSSKPHDEDVEDGCSLSDNLFPSCHSESSSTLSQPFLHEQYVSIPPESETNFELDCRLSPIHTDKNALVTGNTGVGPTVAAGPNWQDAETQLDEPSVESMGNDVAGGCTGGTCRSSQSFPSSLKWSQKASEKKSMSPCEEVKPAADSESYRSARSRHSCTNGHIAKGSRQLRSVVSSEETQLDRSFCGNATIGLTFCANTPAMEKRNLFSERVDSVPSDGALNPCGSPGNERSLYNVELPCDSSVNGFSPAILNTAALATVPCTSITTVSSLQQMQKVPTPRKSPEIRHWIASVQTANDGAASVIDINNANNGSDKVHSEDKSEAFSQFTRLQEQRTPVGSPIQANLVHLCRKRRGGSNPGPDTPITSTAFGEMVIPPTPPRGSTPASIAMLETNTISRKFLEGSPLGQGGENSLLVYMSERLTCFCFS